MQVQITMEAGELTETVLHALRLLGSGAQDPSVSLSPPAISDYDLAQGKLQAEGLVEAWTSGWGVAGEEIDRVRILSTFLNGVGGKDLMGYLRHEGKSTRNLIEAGATEEMAGNIIAVGAASLLWETHST